MHAPQTEADQRPGPPIHVHPIVNRKRSQTIPPYPIPHTHTQQPHTDTNHQNPDRLTDPEVRSEEGPPDEGAGSGKGAR